MKEGPFGFGNQVLIPSHRNAAYGLNVASSLRWLGIST